MIRMRISGPNFEDLAAMVDRLEHPDLLPLAQALVPIMIRDNRDGLLAGLDANGSTMDPIEEATVRRGRGGDGPPLVPRREASRAIADYDVEIQEGDNRILLVGGWRNSPFIHFHADGTKYMVARNPVGIRPSGEEEIGDTLFDFASSLIGGQP